MENGRPVVGRGESVGLGGSQVAGREPAVQVQVRRPAGTGKAPIRSPAHPGQGPAACGGHLRRPPRARPTAARPGAGAERAQPRETIAGGEPLAGQRGRKPALWAFRRMCSPLLPAVPSRTASPYPDRKGGICRADARRTFRHTGRFGRQPYGGTPKRGFRPNFPPYARYRRRPRMTRWSCR
jgi:hypothetical protein